MIVAYLFDDSVDKVVVVMGIVAFARIECPDESEGNCIAGFCSGHILMLMARNILQSLIASSMTPTIISPESPNTAIIHRTTSMIYKINANTSQIKLTQRFRLKSSSPRGIR